MRIENILRLSLDKVSFSLIDSLAKMIVKYKIPIEVHDWGVVGRAEKLDISVLDDYKQVRDYLFLKIKEFAEKYNAPSDYRYYLTHSAKRSQKKYYSEFFPTTFPNGNVYGCSMAMKLGYMGNINKENLLGMIFKWKKSLPGFFVLSNSSCHQLKKFLPEKFQDRCEFCKNLPFSNNIPKEAIGREFIKINTKIDFNKVLKRLNNEREYLLSFRLTENDLNIETGIKIKNFLDKLKKNEIRFVLSRPLPKCLGVIVDSNQPKNCFECRELFTIENEFVKYCETIGEKKGCRLEYVKNRKQIFDYFEIEHDKLKIPDKCKKCIYFLRKTCNGMCFVNRS